MGKKAKPWFLPGWAHKRVRRKRKLKKLRETRGDDCWLCGFPMRFGGPPNCGKAATVEHLMPVSKGGTWAMANLRLCHVGCNRHLGDRTPEQKERMRTNVRLGLEHRVNAKKRQLASRVPML